MRWGAPLAGLLALAIALPIVAHLLSRRRPTQVPFPTLRFLRGGSPVSRRLRRFADVPLLLLRMTIVGAIAAAAAGPTLVTPARQRAWQERLHRVIVVDETLKDAAAGTISELRREAESSLVMATDTIAEQLAAINADLAARAHDSRVELVVLWDGSRDALTPNDIAAVPHGVGVRLQAVDRLVVRDVPPAASSRSDRAIEVVAVAADEPVRDALVGRLRETGTPRPRVPVRVTWPGTDVEPAIDSAPVSTQGMPGVLDAIADDLRLRDAAWRSSLDVRTTTTPGERTASHARVLARAGTGEPLLHGWWAGETLVLTMHAAPASPLAWWSLVSVAEAVADRERNTGGIGDMWTAAQRAAAGRDAQVPSASSMPGGIDARVAWAGVLVLLIVEQVWRRRGRVEADAA